MAFSMKLAIVLMFGCGLSSFAQLALADDLDEPPVTSDDRDHWSFRPLTRPRVPETEPSVSGDNPIDCFVLRRLQRVDLRLQPPATRETLIRRLSFDLVGLPPTPAEVDAFTNDRSPNAYDRLVDRLLASHHYGERWAQHWLDLARFAETDGFEHDKVRPEAWRFRDWVIDALNRDMPYDRFVQLQLAGDEIEPRNPNAAIATSFCLSGPDMPDINSQDERRHNLLNEMTSTVGEALLGLQIGCARCHNHKYDPISQADFYRMRAIFDPAVTVKKNRSISILRETAPPPPSHLMIRGDWQRTGPEVEPAFPRIANATDQPFTPIETDDSTSGRRAALAFWLTRPDNPLTARVIVNRIWQHHFGRGLSQTPSDFGVIGDSPSHPELLDWLATELVRHHWSLKHLHRLIVTSATYRQCSLATPASSSPFEAALERDPNNTRLSRFSRQRLEGEVIRDAMLAAAGVLNTARYGPGVRPPLPAELTSTLLKNQWVVEPDLAEHDRRGVYLFARRNLRYPAFEAFDRPDANASCGQRGRSTTAIQSLLLLNSDFSFRTAGRMADDIIKRSQQVDHQIIHAFRRALGRVPTDGEIHASRTFFAEPARDSAAASNANREALTHLCLALFNCNEFLYVD